MMSYPHLFKHWGAIIAIQLISTLTFSQGVALAQHSPKVFNIEIKPLAVGEKVPYEFMREILNQVDNPKGKPKLVILDFWATWCTSCTYNFNKMDTLQKNFGNDIAVILVNAKNTGDDKKKIENFFTRREKITNVKLTFPSIALDSIFSIFFEHRTIPHYAWIDDLGTVKAITSSAEVSALNIKSILEGSITGLPVKRDIVFDDEKPLFGQGNDNNIVYRSTLSKYVDGINSRLGFQFTKDKLVKRAYYTNTSILELIKFAFPEMVNYPQSQTIFNVNDINKLKKDGDWGSWKYDNTYCYELIIAPTPLQKVYSEMQTQLQDLFKLDIKFVKQKRKCFLLKSIDEKLLPSAQEQTPDLGIDDNSDELVFIKNYPIDGLVEYLNSHFEYPVLNCTGINRPIDMFFHKKWNSDLESIRKELSRYGLIMVEEERMFDLVEIVDRK